MCDEIREYYVAKFSFEHDCYIQHSITMSLEDCKRYLINIRKTDVTNAVSYVILAVLDV